MSKQFENKKPLTEKQKKVKLRRNGYAREAAARKAGQETWEWDLANPTPGSPAWYYLERIKFQELAKTIPPEEQVAVLISTFKPEEGAGSVIRKILYKDTAAERPSHPPPELVEIYEGVPCKVSRKL